MKFKLILSVPKEKVDCQEDIIMEASVWAQGETQLYFREPFSYCVQHNRVKILPSLLEKIKEYGIEESALISAIKERKKTLIGRLPSETKNERTELDIYLRSALSNPEFNDTAFWAKHINEEIFNRNANDSSKLLSFLNGLLVIRGDKDAKTISRTDLWQFMYSYMYESDSITLNDEMSTMQDANLGEWAITEAVGYIIDQKDKLFLNSKISA